MSVFNPITSDYTSLVATQICEKLCLKEDLADVHFVFKSDDDLCEMVPAHKLILKAASDVFRTMFNGTWKEKTEVDIVDVSVEVFKEFLQFFYLGRVKLTMENVADVMNLGKMYDVAECVSVCGKFIKNNLNNNNVLQNYALALLLDQQDLKIACETVIGVNIKEVFKSTDFLAWDQKMLLQILKLNWLSCTEVELFEACMSWVKAASKQNDLTKDILQAHLGDLFYNIRFGSMQLEEFSTLVPTYGKLFTGAEYAEIIQIISNNEFQANKFNGNRKKRCESNPWNERDEIYCYRLIAKYRSSERYFIKKLETTKFSVDQPFLLNGFTINFIEVYDEDKKKNIGCESISSDITIVELFGSGDGKTEVVKYNGQTNLNSSVSMNTMNLSKLVHVKPGFVYEIRLKQNPPANCTASHLVRTEVQLKNGNTIQFHDDPLIPGDFASTGLIYNLHFYQIQK